jgi:4-diphosphocytidyl-2-C-methyl-D-erythritol kinase
MPQLLTRRAYGKINLGLDVIRRREDGYHEVKMIMQMVDIYDELTMSERIDGQIMICTNSAELPNDEHNLIYKAIVKYREDTGETMGVDVKLCKHIPIAAGMAGGSTDAAAALILYNTLCGRALSGEALCKIGVRVGADVPYCIMGGTVLSEGIGEILTPLIQPPDCTLVIAKPDIAVSTKFVYEHLDLASLTHHPDIDGMREAIEKGNLQGICDRMENVLESVTVKEYPIIAQIKELFLQNGAVSALMSGSGPTVFAIFTDKKQAEHAKEKVAEANIAKQLFVTAFHQSVLGD